HRLNETLVRRFLAILGNVAGRQYQINRRDFAQHVVDDRVQRSEGVQAQQLLGRTGIKMAVSQLNHLDSSSGGGRGGWRHRRCSLIGGLRVRRERAKPLRSPAMMATDRRTIQRCTGAGDRNMRWDTKKLVGPGLYPGGAARASAVDQHRMGALAVAVTIAEPLTEKLIELEFLVRLQHLLIGIR